MGDTDFPAVLGNRMASNPAGYLQQYVKGMKEYEQAGTDIPDLRVQDEYAQEAGGPLIESYEISADPSFDLMGPDIDSPVVDKWIQNTRPQPRIPRDRLLENIRRVRGMVRGV
jgi:hypothetical protein